MNKKAFLSLPILFLVILEICLIMFTLFYFNSKHSFNEQKIVLSNQIDSVYFKETQINLLTQNILDGVSHNFNPGLGKDDFISRLKEELHKYSFQTVPELNQIESQLTDANIQMNDKTVSILLSFKIDNSNSYSSSSVKVSYVYTKNFHSTFDYIHSPSENIKNS